MIEAFKVVGRHPEDGKQRLWARGIYGTQAKKAEYIGREKFEKYSGELIKRWVRCYDVEVYEMDGTDWAMIQTFDCLGLEE